MVPGLLLRLYVTNPNELLITIEDGSHAHWCPGCQSMHVIPASWQFDGNTQRPSFSPSAKHTWTWGEAKENKCCHYFIKLGKLIYCSDCTHGLANQIIPLPPVSDRGW